MLDVKKLKIGDVVQDICHEYLEKWRLLEYIEEQGEWKCECICKGNTVLKVGYIRYWKFNESYWQLIESAPEPEPEAWQPKEGDIVWDKLWKQKLKVHMTIDGDFFCSDKNGYKNLPTLIHLEPYTNQDIPKIDFSQAGRVLTDGKELVLTNGYESGDYFGGIRLGASDKNGYEPLYKNNWRDITDLPETQELLKLLEICRNLKK